MLIILLEFIFAILLYKLYSILTKNLDYWKKKNVPHPTPRLLFGNYKDYILLKKSIFKIASEFCDQFPNEPYIGVLYGTEPALIIKDPNIIRLVLSKDFYYFNGREIGDYSHKEALTNHLFFNAGDKWKVIRQNLTPMFTSGKLKNMFPLIQSCNKELEQYLQEETSKTRIIDLRSVFTRYAMECIINCAFGINAHTMKRANIPNPFVTVGQKIFESSYTRGLKMICRSMWPSLFYSLGFQLFDEKISVFFRNLYNEVYKNRVKEKSTRNDFIDLLLTWHKNNHLSGDSLSNMKSDENKVINIEVNEELLLSQSILIFGAGFETTSTTIGFLLYELAKNQNAQAKVIEEVDAYFKKHNGIIEYECVNELRYIESCIHETLRLYPVFGIVTREVTDDYVLPTGLRLHKYDRVHIPIYHIHRNPNYFKDPEIFRPERFLGDEKMKIKPFTYMPFGEGPRICIGIRFAKMTAYPGILTLFKKYRIEMAENTPLGLDFKAGTFTTQSMTDVKLKLIVRS